jgi:hypothetical protein
MASKAAETASHPRLSESRAFRLFRLNSQKATCADHEISHLGCDSEAFELDSFPLFYALSYTWGSARVDQKPGSISASRCIELNGFFQSLLLRTV